MVSSLYSRHFGYRRRDLYVHRLPMSDDDRLLHRSVTDAILGAFYATHSHLGHGFLEGVYANALTILLRRAGLRVERETPFDVVFGGESVGRYRADIVVESAVIVEVKAAQAITPAHAAQLLNYLRASDLQVGLVLNFGQRAEFRRVVSTRRRQSALTS